MGILEDALNYQDTKRSQRMAQAALKAKIDARKIKEGTYRGIDLIDGTARIQLDGQPNTTSGYRLITNAPLGDGDRVSIRPDGVGLPRADARNVAPVADITESEQVQKSLIYVTNFSDATISVINTRNLVIDTIEGFNNYTSFMAYCPKNNSIYVSDYQDSLDDRIKVVNLNTNEIVSTIQLDKGRIVDIIYCPLNKKIYVSCAINGEDDRIAVINPITNTVDTIIPLGLNGSPSGLAYCPSNKKIYVAANQITGSSHFVVRINPVTDTIDAVIAVTHQAFYLVYCPANNSIYVSSQNTSLSVIDVATNAVTLNIYYEAGFGITFLVYCPFNRKIYGSSVSASAAFVINPITNAADAAINEIGYGGLAYCSSNNRIYAADFSGDKIHVINPVTNTIDAVLEVGSSPYQVLCVER